MNPLRIFLVAALVLVVFGVGNSSAELPDLEVSPSDIELEIDGVIGNASQLKDGDTVVIITDIKNIGDADADGTSVEIFYYPENPPESDSEKEDLVADGFVFDEQKNIKKQERPLIIKNGFSLCRKFCFSPTPFDEVLFTKRSLT